MNFNRSINLTNFKRYIETRSVLQAIGKTGINRESLFAFFSYEISSPFVPMTIKQYLLGLVKDNINKPYMKKYRYSRC
jgi:hypothetical protein